MNPHQRLSADRAGRRITTVRCRSVIAFAFTLAFLAVACSPDPAPDSTTAPVTSTTEVNGVGSETLDASAAVEPDPEPDADPEGEADGGEAEPDYTAEELEALLNTPTTYNEVLDATEPEPLETGSPEAAIADIKTELDTSTATATDQTPVLDQVQPVDAGPTDTVIGIREGRHINEAGEPIQLDEAAALACGNVEIALTAIDDGNTDKAVDRLRAASTLVAGTSVTAMNAWSSILEQSADDLTAGGPAAVDGSPMIAFLSTCAQGGYEL